MSVNKVILIGRLGKDPEVRKTSSSASVANFTLATREVYKKQDGTYDEQTEWHNVVMWRLLADNAEKILKKGQLVYVEGKLKTRQWDDKDGHKRYTTEIHAENFNLLEKRTEQNTNEVQTNANSTNIEQNFNDGLPF